MKAGIVADNWKVPIFERELTAAGFAFDKMPFTKETTTIRVTCRPDQIGQVHAICAKVQSEAFHQKQKEN